MHKSRLFVVDSESLVSTIDTGVASVIMPEKFGEEWLKTTSDIMADMLQCEIGDYVFLWEMSTSNYKSRIHGVYRIISKPYYECSNTSERAPFKIHIEKAYDFAEPIDEYDVLNCPYVKDKMWTLIGKKVSGKARGSTPLSLEEAKTLFLLLRGKNIDYKFFPFDEKNIINIKNPLEINYLNFGENKKPTTLMDLNPNELNYFKEDYSLYYEKTLETIFNQEMSRRNESFFMQLGIDVNKVIWFSNYLPYSIERMEMDYVIIESEDDNTISNIYVIEFMKTRIDADHIRRVMIYSKWVSEVLALGTSIVQPIIISADSFDFIKGESKKKRSYDIFERLTTLISDLDDKKETQPLKVFEYSFDYGNPILERKK